MTTVTENIPPSQVMSHRRTGLIVTLIGNEPDEIVTAVKVPVTAGVGCRAVPLVHE